MGAYHVVAVAGDAILIAVVAVVVAVVVAEAAVRILKQLIEQQTECYEPLGMGVIAGSGGYRLRVRGGSREHAHGHKAERQGEYQHQTKYFFGFLHF